MEQLTAEETAIADMKKEFDTLVPEDTIEAHIEPIKELYSKSIEFIPNRHGLKTTVGYISFDNAGHINS